MPITCPKCGTSNPTDRHTCRLCGTELVLTASVLRRPALNLDDNLFGPPAELKGRYQVGQAISQGTQVSLYRATDRRTGQPCLVHQTTLTTPDMDLREVLEERFLQEAARWAGRRHPNILPILDADVQNHRLYLITAPIRGQSLHAIIQDRDYTVPDTPCSVGPNNSPTRSTICIVRLRRLSSAACLRRPFTLTRSATCRLWRLG